MTTVVVNVLAELRALEKQVVELRDYVENLEDKLFDYIDNLREDIERK